MLGPFSLVQKFSIHVRSLDPWEILGQGNRSTIQPYDENANIILLGRSAASTTLLDRWALLLLIAST
jgi:hypothetical protein